MKKLSARFTLTQKALLLAGSVLLGYAFLVALFAAFFVANPVQTAKLLGIVKPAVPGFPNTGGVNAPGGNSPIQALFQPIGRVSLGLVRNLNPNSYLQVSKATILDANDVLGRDANGAIVPQQPISIPNSSLLQVGSNGLIANLNSQYLQGLQPGTSPGDIAIVGSSVPLLPETGTVTSGGITNADLSGSAGITNANLANPSVTVNTSGPLSGGGAVALGGTLTLSCSGCSTSAAASGITASSTDTLTNKTIDAASNSISGLTAGNLAAGDFSSKITSGTYSINITGTVTSAVNFTGPLAGDITGTQGSTTVGKINGATLGTTTATSGNLLIADGLSWITRSLSGDATLTSTGALTLTSVSTPGTFGSGASIPVVTIDSKGRVLGVTDTTVSGLTPLNFSSAGISQWTNDTGYITSSSTDTLSNKSIDANLNGISSLVPGNFGTANVSQWTNDVNYITDSSTDTLSNKTIDGGFNTITGIPNLFTVGATAGPSSSISQGGTLTLAAGSNLTTTNNGTGEVTIATSSTPTFTTVNGLAITSNGTNTLTIAAGKTLTVSNSLTFTGTDGKSFVFPTNSDDIVGRTEMQTLTNKTIDAGSNTISGLTNANLSGTAGITNANLANSDLTVDTTGPLSGGGLVSLGGTLTLSCPTCMSGGASMFEVASTTGPNSSIFQNDTLTLAAGTNISTTNDGSATVTFATVNNPTFSGLITGSNGLTISTGAIRLTGTSGFLSLSGMTASSISTGANNLTFTSGNFNTTATGINSTAIGATTASTGAFTTLSSTGTTNIGSGTGVVTIASSGILGHTSGVTTGTGSSSAFVFNASSLSSGTALRLTSTSTSGLLFDQNATNTSGTIDKLAYGTATTLSGTTTGLNFDLNTNVTATGITLTGETLATAADTNINNATKKGIAITSGAITQNTGGATGSYIGLDVTVPSLTLTTGTALNGYGMRVTTGNITQSAGTLTSNGLLVDSTGSTITTGGTINGIKINAPTTIPAVGTYNNLYLGTSTSSTANSYDAATIAVGNIASTTQQNFATLNVTNGGSGFLDLELIRGFINFQGMNTLYDDFTGNSLDITSKWVSTVTGGATTCSTLAGGLNGLLRLRTGNGSDRGCELTTQTITTLTNGYYQRGNNPIFETKLKIDTLANARIVAGFTDTRVAVTNDAQTSTNHAYIVKRAADTNWQCVTDDGGATETTTDTGVAIVANTFYRLRVGVQNGSTPQVACTIDDGTTVTRTVITTHLPGATSPMDVYVRDSQSDSVQKNMDVDYVRAWQDDPPLAVDGTATPAPAVSDASTSANVLAVESSPTSTPTPSEAASSPESLPELVSSSITNLLKNLVEFFGNVVFHADVTFLGRPTFNKDTAGHISIKAGSDEVSVVFDKEYAHNPVVTASVNLVDGDSEIPTYAIYNLSTKGFKIKLSKVATSDLDFSWAALSVLSPTVTPSALPSPSQEVTPSPTVTEQASPSASTP